jgi:hypothetical protein
MIHAWALTLSDYHEPIRLRSFTLVSNQTGDVSAQCEIESNRRRLRDATQFVRLLGRTATITYRSRPVWVGTLHIVDGWTLVLRGLAAMLNDVRYTACWSDTRFSQWEIPPPTASSDWLPSAWQHDTNNRLYASTRPNETYGGAGARRAMAWAYRVPVQSLVNLGWTQATIELLGGMWSWAMTAYTSIPEMAAWTSGPTVIMTASGTYTYNNTAAPAMTIRTVPPGTPIIETSPTDTRVFRATAVRVANHAPPITATEIVEHALQHAQTQLGTTLLRGWRVASSSTDIEIAVWEDATVREVVAWAAQQLGAEWWVERDAQAIHIAANRSRRRWSPASSATTVTQGIDQMATRVYARYRNPAGNRTLRTTTAVATAAEQQYRLARTAVIDVATTSATTATAARDAALTTLSQQPPSAVVIARQRGDLMGITGPAWPWEAEPGDIMTIPDTPPLIIACKTITPDQTTYELTAPTGTLFSALAR